MATWTNFYIHTDKTQAVSELLANLTGDLVVIYEADFPQDIGQYQLLNTGLAPNYIAIGNTQPGWATIVHNSFAKMEDWGILLSRQFDCQLVVTIAQSVSSYYYFALYEKGIKRREIETCYSTDFQEINFGDRFDFEGIQPGKKEHYDDEEYYLFDFESIEEYCQYFDLTIQTDYNNVKWTLLKGKNIKKEVQEYIQKNLIKKPWWKFW